LAGAAYGPCGMPHPDPPTLPTLSAPRRGAALPLAELPSAPDVVAPDVSTEAALVAPSCPGVPLQAEITSAAAAAKAVRLTARFLFIDIPPREVDRTPAGGPHRRLEPPDATNFTII
jgi:hypothetical protein